MTSQVEHARMVKNIILVSSKNAFLGSSRDEEGKIFPSSCLQVLVIFFFNDCTQLNPNFCNSPDFRLATTMESFLFRSVSSPLLLESTNLLLLLLRTGSASSPRFSSPVTVLCSSRNHAYIPKLEPFSRTKLDRAIKEPHLIEKSENELSDYCSTLDGDDSYSWKAYFELKDIEKESPKQEVEKLILQAGGVKSLIGCLHGIAAIHKGKGSESNSRKGLNGVEGRGRDCPIPDGLPKSAEEVEEEERGRMPDSPFTRLLRSKGTFPAWYSPAPDHETD